jgi:hypothetical protein
LQEVADDLRETVDAAERELRLISEADSAKRPAPKKWSAKEILGHLIDSAANNHSRFVRGALGDELVFPGYDQNAWVTLQNYQSRSWNDLIDLWSAYNRHLSEVIATIPKAALTRRQAKHNFDQIAWKPVPANEASMLEYLIRDYIDHLRHHLEQIRATLLAD